MKSVSNVLRQSMQTTAGRILTRIAVFGGLIFAHGAVRQSPVDASSCKNCETCQLCGGFGGVPLCIDWTCCTPIDSYDWHNGWDSCSVNSDGSCSVGNYCC